MYQARIYNTNNGNSSRRFFIDPELAAEIASIDPHLTYRFKVILETTYQVTSIASDDAQYAEDTDSWS